jgi:hypothetical protein
MKTSPVTFCQSSVEQIIDHHTKASILESIRQCTSINIADRRTNLIRTPKDASYLRNPHFITLATHGQRWMMYLTQVNHANKCVLIERSVKPGYPYPKMLVVHYQFNEVLYQNTLFDLEIIDNAKGYDTPLILVCDIVMMKNREVSAWDPVKKMNTLHIIFSNQFHDNMHMQPAAIQMKRLFCTSQFADMTKFIRTLPYATKGLHFTPLNSKYPTRTWIDTRRELTEGVTATAAAAAAAAQAPPTDTNRPTTASAHPTPNRIHHPAPLNGR